jgi:hypothetical protein
MNHLRALRTAGVRLAVPSQFPWVAQGLLFFRCVGCETTGVPAPHDSNGRLT